MFDFLKPLTDETAFPSKPGSGQAARAQFMVLFNEAKDAINSIFGSGVVVSQVMLDKGLVSGVVDFNTLVAMGVYKVGDTSTSTNAPGSYGVLTIEVSGGYVTQVFRNVSGHKYRFSSDSGVVWSAWLIDIARIPAFAWSGTIDANNTVTITHNLGYNPLVDIAGSQGNIIITHGHPTVNTTTITNYSTGANSFLGTANFY